MTSGTGNEIPPTPLFQRGAGQPLVSPPLKKGGQGGFTLIEVLVAVSIMAIGLGSILGGYRVLLDGYKKGLLLMEGVSFLEERMTDREIEIRGGAGTGGSPGGSEPPWIWSAEVKETGKDNWYEVRGEISREGKGGKITLFRYVRK